MLPLSCSCAAITVQPARQEADCQYVSGSISPTDILLCCYIPKALVCVEFEDFSDNGCRKHIMEWMLIFPPCFPSRSDVGAVE